MKLSIVIVSWNTEQMLAQCLDSIFKYPPAAQFEVWCVDNASTDGSASLVRRCYPQVQLIENDDNRGFAAANNQAIGHCTGQYVLLLNSDTEVYPGALQRLLDYMEANPQVGAAGPLILNPDQTLQTSCYPEMTLTREFWRLFHLDTFIAYGVYHMANWPVDRPQQVDNLLGACIILRRTVLDQVGLLDESYFMYTEEIDLCYRIAQAGWHLHWVPTSRIVHYGGQSTKQVPLKMFLSLYQTKLFYFRKHHGSLAAQLYKLILLLVSLQRLIVSPLARLGRADKQQGETLAERYKALLKALPNFI